MSDHNETNHAASSENCQLNGVREDRKSSCLAHALQNENASATKKVLSAISDLKNLISVAHRQRRRDQACSGLGE